MTSTYESHHFRLVTLQTKLKQKIVNYSLDEKHTKRKIQQVLAHSPPSLCVRK